MASLTNALTFIAALIALVVSVALMYSESIPMKNTSSLIKPKSTTKTLQIDGNEISYVVIGEGHPVFQFHPTPGSKQWRHINEEALANKYKIQLIRFDRPGFGQTRGNLSVHQIVSSLAKTLQLDSYSVLGYELGAYQALTQALVDDKINGVAIIAPPTSSSQCPFHSVMRGMYNLFGPTLSSRLTQPLHKLAYNVAIHRACPCSIPTGNNMLFRLGALMSCQSIPWVTDKLIEEPWREMVKESLVEAFAQNTISQWVEWEQWFVGKTFQVKQPVWVYASSAVSTDKFSDKMIVSTADEGLTPFETFVQSYEQALSVLSQNSPKKRNEPNMNPTKPTTQQDTATTAATPSESTPSSTTTPTQHNICVIGGGLAGLSASIELAKQFQSSPSQHHHIMLLEKEDRTGGNSAKATSGINGMHTNAQKQQNISDSFDLFYGDTIVSGKKQGNPSLVTTLVKQSTGAIEFLEEHGIGMELLTQCGGHSVPRTHRSAPPKVGRAMNVGSEMTSKLLRYIQDKLPQQVTVMTKTKMTGFVVDEHKNPIGIRYVRGDEGAEERMMCQAIVLTTGGYAADRKGYLEQYAPHLSHLPTTNGAFADGGGIRMSVQELGAALIHMNSIQVHPTGFIDQQNPKSMTVFLAAEALRAYGGIIVNEHGKRFCNELGRRDYVSDMIFKNCGKEVEGGHTTAYMIMNDYVARSFSESLLSFYMSKGFIKKYDNLEVACNETHLPLDAVRETILEYNGYHEQHERNESFVDVYGKNLFPTSFDVHQSIYVSRITPSIHYTHGGLVFDELARVMRKVGEGYEPIPNLYTAGEASGGLHGLNRLAGNSLLECVVFGRIAAREIFKLSSL